MAKMIHPVARRRVHLHLETQREQRREGVRELEDVDRGDKGGHVAELRDRRADDERDAPVHECAQDPRDAPALRVQREEAEEGVRMVP